MVVAVRHNKRHLSAAAVTSGPFGNTAVRPPQVSRRRYAASDDRRIGSAIGR